MPARVSVYPPHSSPRTKSSRKRHFYTTRNAHAALLQSALLRSPVEQGQGLKPFQKGSTSESPRPAMPCEPCKPRKRTTADVGDEATGRMNFVPPSLARFLSLRCPRGLKYTRAVKRCTTSSLPSKVRAAFPVDQRIDQLAACRPNRAHSLRSCEQTNDFKAIAIILTRRHQPQLFHQRIHHKLDKPNPHKFLESDLRRHVPLRDRRGAPGYGPEAHGSRARDSLAGGAVLRWAIQHHQFTPLLAITEYRILDKQSRRDAREMQVCDSDTRRQKRWQR
ncbi:hypothetical protein BCR34DRAFT_641683 [Clohesyomyces aquaticus]|uniref:Uncharacterized protein n=1 Tax=Clohesyomyces aquaticus TaxID=1231657 RepID=A0A1Y1ZZN7_9PLEO|nr:hypothetical protein BCR34DRAFT_641683 [Clohesyomyces aquaticus]